MFNFRNHLSQIVKSTAIAASGLGSVFLGSSLLGRVGAESTDEINQKSGLMLQEDSDQLTPFIQSSSSLQKIDPTSDQLIGTTLSDLNSTNTLSSVEVIGEEDDLELEYLTEPQPLKAYVQGGSEFLVNTYTTEAQTLPQVVALDDGGFVIAWQSRDQDGSGYGIYGQRYNSAANEADSEFKINTYTANAQENISIASLVDGGFIVTWQSGNQDGDESGVFSQRYDVTGSAVGSEFQVNTYTTGQEWGASVAGLNDGGFVIVWENWAYSGNEGVFGKRYDSLGNVVGSEFQINSVTGHNPPKVNAFSEGGFVVVWEASDGHYAGVIARIYDSSATPITSEFVVNTYSDYNQQEPDIATLTNDDFIIVWHSNNDYDSSHTGIFAQRFDKMGTPIRDEFCVVLDGWISKPKISPLNDGGFVVAWQGTYGNITAQKFDSNDNKVGSQFLINKDIAGGEGDASIANLSGGGFVATFRRDTYGGGVADGSEVGVYARISVPSIITNSLTISEGETKLITIDTLEAEDMDSSDDSIIFTVSSVMYGQFEEVSNPNVAILSFTQAQIKNSEIQFVHDGSVNSPSYEVKAGDGELETVVQAANINFTETNDSPILVDNSLSITEGGTVVLSIGDLSATDEDDNDNDLVFTVSDVLYGQFEKYTTSWNQVTSFTQLDIINEAVRFVHDGTENTPSYQVSVSDGDISTSPSSASVTFTPVNDSPVLVDNQLNLNEGQIIVLSSSDLSATDEDDVDSGLEFTVSNVLQGEFQKYTSSWEAVTTFMQQDILDSRIRFVHDGSNNAPSYDVSVSDGKITTAPVSANIIFNDIPELINNSLMLSEGDTITLTSNDLSALDSDDGDEQLAFTVSDLLHGQFEKYNTTWEVVTNFTQQNILDGIIRFVHDGGESAPAYKVSVSDGSTSCAAQFATITFTNVNDLPSLINNELVISDGETLVLTTDNLNATDTDDEDMLLNFNISDITHGRFEQVSNPGVAVTQFIQQQIVDGDIQFVHDGSGIVPTFKTVVNDGKASTAPSSATVSLNVRPVLVVHQLTISEGEIKILTNSELSASDVDNDDLGLIFSVDDVHHGQIEELIHPGVAITQFTQQQIVDGDVQFVHDGGEDAPSLCVKVSDGDAETSFETVEVSFTNVNDAPVINGGGVILSYIEGQSPQIIDSSLSVSDVDNVDLASASIQIIENYQESEDLLIFTDTNKIAGSWNSEMGKLLLNGTATLFEYESALKSIQYENISEDPSTEERTISWIVNDGKQNSNSVFSIIQVSSVNDVPVIQNNQLDIKEGETVILNNSNLSSSDPDNTSDELSFIISSIENGQFEEVSNPGVSITEFTQQQINNLAIQFVHDGSESAPSYEVVITDGVNSGAAKTANIIFTNVNDAPELEINQLTLHEHDTVILTLDMLKAMDVDNLDSELIFSISELIHGYFQSKSYPGVELTNFTQQDVIDGLIQFVHDGSEEAPSYKVSVNDGSLSSESQMAIINFTNTNDLPEIEINKLDIISGQKLLITNNMLKATDVELDDGELTFIIGNVQHGRFELMPSETMITSFKQKQIADPGIQFVHDGSNKAPSYEVKVSDGESETEFELAKIKFIPESANPEDNTQNETGMLVTILGGTGGAIGATVAGFFGKRYTNSLTRKNYPFADAVRKALKIKKVDNFNSQQGQLFVKVVSGINTLTKKIIKVKVSKGTKKKRANIEQALNEGLGIDITNYTITELEYFAKLVAQAMKLVLNRGKSLTVDHMAALNSNIESKGLTGHLAKIVAKTRELKINTETDELSALTIKSEASLEGSSDISLAFLEDHASATTFSSNV